MRMTTQTNAHPHTHTAVAPVAHNAHNATHMIAFAMAAEAFGKFAKQLMHT